MAIYINENNERENAWYEVKRYRKGSNGINDDRDVTFHNTRRQAEQAQKKAIATGKYEAVFIDFIAENSGIID